MCDGRVQSRDYYIISCSVQNQLSLSHRLQIPFVADTEVPKGMLNVWEHAIPSRLMQKAGYSELYHDATILAAMSAVP